MLSLNNNEFQVKGSQAVDEPNRPSRFGSSFFCVQGARGALPGIKLRKYYVDDLFRSIGWRATPSRPSGRMSTRRAAAGDDRDSVWMRTDGSGSTICGSSRQDGG